MVLQSQFMQVLIPKLMQQCSFLFLMYLVYGLVGSQDDLISYVTSYILDFDMLENTVIHHHYKHCIKCQVTDFKNFYYHPTQKGHSS